jgi:hypothetical protein
MTPIRYFPARLFWLLSLLAVFLAACSPAAAVPTPTVTVLPSATSSVTATPTTTTTPTSTLTPTATQVRTPPALPDIFKTSLLNPVDPPHTYVKDTCQYLKEKWSSTNSVPGTVVMPLMFHSITNQEITEVGQVSEKSFRKLMESLKNNGFEAITMTQMADFMEHNAKIPPLSVLVIVDDRRTKQYYDEWFRQYWEEWKWPVVNAWISTPLSDADLWKQMEDLEKEGWVDHQAHGVGIVPLWPGVSDAYVTGELQGSIDAFQQHFNKSPIAIIWPGGGFSTHSIAIARQLGYRLGFTTSSRGPVMFNWVPLGDRVTEVHGDGWQPEGPMNDPLMVLPRYWDTFAGKYVEDVVQISQAAAAYDEQNKATEQDYYDIVCAPQYGPIP